MQVVPQSAPPTCAMGLCGCALSECHGSVRARAKKCCNSLYKASAPRRSVKDTEFTVVQHSTVTHLRSLSRGRPAMAAVSNRQELC